MFNFKSFIFGLVSPLFPFLVAPESPESLAVPREVFFRPLTVKFQENRVSKETVEMDLVWVARRVFNDSVPTRPIRQFQVNQICSALNKHRIGTRSEFLEHLEAIVADSHLDPSLSSAEIFQHLKAALKAHSQLNALHVCLVDRDFECFLQVAKRGDAKPANRADDLPRVTRNYDRLAQSRQQVEGMSGSIAHLLKGREDAVVPALILGAGDNGTTLWLEKYEQSHGAATGSLKEGRLPNVLILGQDLGLWRHDYTFAQPHSLLERPGANANPESFVSTPYYQRDPLVNARHLHQANTINLAESQAPVLLGITIKRVETRDLHAEDWKYSAQQYRVILSAPDGEKAIYADDIDVTLGNGPSRFLPIVNLLENPTDFDRLSSFDESKHFTPIVDGVQFKLTASEEKGKKARKIVVYGGGGTAAGCYRKGFFGTDIHSEGKLFNEKNQRNEMLWFSRSGNDTGGTGRLVAAMYKEAISRGEFAQAEIVKIREVKGKLVLDIQKNGRIEQVECDQLVYCVGQEQKSLRGVTEELTAQVVLDSDAIGAPLTVKTPDSRVHFYGPSAFLAPKIAFFDESTVWLKKEHVPPDVVATVMPSTRAQMRGHIHKTGKEPRIVNVNTDMAVVMESFFCSAGVSDFKEIVDDLIAARKEGPGGSSSTTLASILKKHGIEGKVRIVGHTSLEKR